MINKLAELEDIMHKAEHAFMYAKEGEKLAPLYKAQEDARKAWRNYRQELYRGSGVLGNEVTI